MRFLGKHVLIAVAAVALLVLAVPVVAQTPSLGDIAKKEQERRKGAKQPAKVYTNDDLKGGGLPSAPPLDRRARDGGGSPAGQADAPSAQAAGDAPKDGKAAGGQGRARRGRREGRRSVAGSASRKRATSCGATRCSPRRCRAASTR